ncbi:MAG: glutamate-5-semialdehyde dehydrogenase, partial [Clostridiales bacterium]|nr:glutamate-5-semialdehyde dehydrogenase [Clostridiales bacterium]
MTALKEIGERAVKAERILACARGGIKDAALHAIAEALLENSEQIIGANALDLENGKKAGLSPSLLDRLKLDLERIEGMAKGVSQIAAMDDPVGNILSGCARPNGLKIQKVSVPLGVIAVIYEARPNVSSDAAALCLKAGNAVILRGGKEAIESNKIIAKTMRAAIKTAGLPEDCIQLVEDTSREGATQLMRMNDYIDVLIPRGGAGLIKAVMENATIPVIETGVGNCHVYVDKAADIDMAAEIVFNAKTSRPSVCNACESLLIHKDIAELALLKISERLAEKNVEIRGDEAVCAVLPPAVPATPEDWGMEYLDYILSVKVVSDIDEAIEHIARYGTKHSECIVTDDYEASQKFLNEVDAAAVYINASTRFTDGGEFGFGAEIGISTQKLHARGPLVLNNLTSDKYL